jgi:hypothetical protein
MLLRRQQGAWDRGFAAVREHVNPVDDAVAAGQLEQPDALSLRRRVPRRGFYFPAQAITGAEARLEVRAW